MQPPLSTKPRWRRYGSVSMPNPLSLTTPSAIFKVNSRKSHKTGADLRESFLLTSDVMFTTSTLNQEFGIDIRYRHSASTLSTKTTRPSTTRLPLVSSASSTSRKLKLPPTWSDNSSPRTHPATPSQVHQKMTVAPPELPPTSATSTHRER